MKVFCRKEHALFWGFLIARLILAVLWFTFAGCASNAATERTGSGGSEAIGGSTGPGTGGVAGTGGSAGGGKGGTNATGSGVGGGLAGGAAGTAENGGSGAGSGGVKGMGGAVLDGGTDAGSLSAGVCPGDKSPNPDVAGSCTPTAAMAGAACTQNCCVGCGIDLLGQATCTCSNHKYVSCTCPRPPIWTALGGECGDSACMTDGGPCSPQGYASSAGAPKGASVLEGQPCVMNGNVCFTAEPDGKHGCVCASDSSGDFVMRCGLVEGWFSNNGMPTTY